MIPRKAKRFSNTAHRSLTRPELISHIAKLYIPLSLSSEGGRDSSGKEVGGNSSDNETNGSEVWILKGSPPSWDRTSRACLVTASILIPPLQRVVSSVCTSSVFQVAGVVGVIVVPYGGGVGGLSRASSVRGFLFIRFRSWISPHLNPFQM